MQHTKQELEQQAHGTHCSPEYTFQINKHTYDYIITLTRRRKNPLSLFMELNGSSFEQT